MKENYGTCHVCGSDIDIPEHELATPALRSRYHCARCGRWIPHPKHHDKEPKSLNPDKPVPVSRLPKSQLTIDLQGGKS